MYGRLLTLALALFAIAPATGAMAEVEVTLAESKARRVIRDTDRIDVRSIPGKFSGIRVYVLDGSAVDISTIDVHYADGTTFTEDRGRLIRLDQVDKRTRVMGPDDGRGREKFIDEIVMHYKTAPGESHQAAVRIVGIADSRTSARAIRPANLAGSATVPSSPTAPVPVNATPGSVTAGGDVLFGVQNVGFSVDRDVISIGRDFGKFDKIRLRVLDNDLYLTEMRVIYSNGEPDVLAVGANVPANSRTKWFNLKGDRFIKEIRLVYKSRPGFRGKARVEVYGEFAQGWYAKPNNGGSGEIVNEGEAFKYGANRGWLYLGGQQPKFFSVRKGLGYETDVISVARNWGFNRMRLDVKDRAITLNRLTVIYGDGTTDTIPVGSKVDGGSSYGPIQLKRKPVREIQVSYRSRIFDKSAAGKGHAFVEFWAQ